MEEKLYGYCLPADISTHGHVIDSLINWLHVFMILLFVGWGVFFVYCLIRFRKGASPTASYHPVKGKLSNYVEIGVIVVEAILLVGVSMPLWAQWRQDAPDAADAVKVHVLAEQFAWNVQYPGADGKFGQLSPALITSDNLLGLNPDDAAGDDDFNSINQIHVPVNKPLIVRLTSKDVIHSFKIPVMRVTQDIIPGAANTIWMTATRIGTYDIACAQLCGLGHYRMRGQLVVESEADYNAWLESMAPSEDDGGFSF